MQRGRCGARGIHHGLCSGVVRPARPRSLANAGGRRGVERCTGGVATVFPNSSRPLHRRSFDEDRCSVLKRFGSGRADHRIGRHADGRVLRQPVGARCLNRRRQHQRPLEYRHVEWHRARPARQGAPERRPARRLDGSTGTCFANADTSVGGGVKAQWNCELSVNIGTQAYAGLTFRLGVDHDPSAGKNYSSVHP